MSMPIDEHDAGKHADAWQRPLADAMAAARPLVLRGLCRDWPLVQQSRRSPSAFAKALAELDAGTPVDVLHMPADADGVVGYDATLDGFNYRHFKVSLTEALTRLAAYSRVEGHVPGLALQSAQAPTFRKLLPHKRPFMIQPTLSSPSSASRVS